MTPSWSNRRLRTRSLITQYLLPHHTRKVCLWGAACCRAVWDYLIPSYQEAVLVLEAYADNQVTLSDLIMAHEAMWDPRLPYDFWRLVYHSTRMPSGSPIPSDSWAYAISQDASFHVTQACILRVEEMASHCLAGTSSPLTTDDILLDLLHPRDFVITMALSPHVKRWANQAYVERDFSSLPQLADLLEEEGFPSHWPCEECQPFGVRSRCPTCKGSGQVTNFVLDHLRSSCTHFKGCWALDAILSKGVTRPL